MSEMKKMSIFGGITHQGDEDLDTLPPLKENATENELLDYIVLVLSRALSCSLAFKGGYMLNQLLAEKSRMTHDIDFSIARQKDYEEVKRILNALCNKFVEMGYITRYKMKEEIHEKMSGGVDMYAADGEKILGVDVGLHDLTYGVRRIKLTSTEVGAFTIERMLSDKLIAITSRKRFRRTKDLYDFYAITNFFDADMIKLKEFIERRGGAEWENIPFNEDVIVQYQRAWDRLDITSYYEGVTIEKPFFYDVLQRFYLLALPLKNGKNVTKWESRNGRCV